MHRTSTAVRRVGTALIAIVLLTTACSSSSDGGDDATASSDTGDAGGVQIAEGPAIATGEGDGDGSGSTIPLEEEEGGGIMEVGTALSIFNDCLDEEGVTFQGVPDGESQDPVLSDPEYGASLGRCANKSKILDAFDELQKQQSDLKPEEIQAQNEVILAVQDCMRAKGWEWGELERGENGGLNPFSNPPKSPDGTSALKIFEHPDLRGCIEDNQIQDNTEGDKAEEG